MTVQAVQEYKHLLSRLSEIIDVSGYRNDYIAQKMGLKPQNFSVKKQKANWSPDEVEQLLTIIHNEDVENYLMLEHMRMLKNEETISIDELKKEIGWK